MTPLKPCHSRGTACLVNYVTPIDLCRRSDTVFYLMLCITRLCAIGNVRLAITNFPRRSPWLDYNTSNPPTAHHPRTRLGFCSMTIKIFEVVALLILVILSLFIWQRSFTQNIKRVVAFFSSKSLSPIFPILTVCS